MGLLMLKVGIYCMPKGSLERLTLILGQFNFTKLKSIYCKKLLLMLQESHLLFIDWVGSYEISLENGDSKDRGYNQQRHFQMNNSLRILIASL